MRQVRLMYRSVSVAEISCIAHQFAFDDLTEIAYSATIVINCQIRFCWRCELINGVNFSNLIRRVDLYFHFVDTVICWWRYLTKGVIDGNEILQYSWFWSLNFENSACTSTERENIQYFVSPYFKTSYVSLWAILSIRYGWICHCKLWSLILHMYGYRMYTTNTKRNAITRM